MIKTPKTYKRRWISTYVEYQFYGDEYVKLREEGYWYEGPMALATTPPTLQCSYWAFYSDGTESASAIIGTQDNNPTKGQIPVDDTFLVRFDIEETSNNKGLNRDAQLWYYHDQGTATWTEVNATSSVIRTVPSANLTNEETTTQRLGGGYSFVSPNGGVDNLDGLAGTSTSDLQNNGMEWLFPVQLRGVDVSEDDTISLKYTELIDGLTTEPTWPSITVPVIDVIYDAAVTAETGPTEAAANAIVTRIASVAAETGPTEASVGTDLTKTYTPTVAAETGPAEAAITAELIRPVQVAAETGPTEATVAATSSVPIKVVTHSVKLPAASDSTWTVDPTTLAGFTPKAVIVFITDCQTAGTPVLGGGCSVGAATGSSNQWTSTFGTEVGTNPANTGRVCYDTMVGRVRQISSNEVDSTLVFDSFHEGGADFDWTVTNASGNYANFIFFAGDDLEVIADTDVISTTQQEYSGTTFAPDMLFTVFCGRTLASGAADSGTSIGFATGVTTTIQQQCINHFADEISPTATSQRVDSNYAAIRTTSALQNAVTIDEFTNTGFKHIESVGSTGHDLLFLALKFGSSVSCWADIVDMPIATGDKSFTNAGGDGPNFKPQFAGFLMSTVTAVDTTVNSSVYTIGMASMDADNDYCHTFSDEDASTAAAPQGYAADQILDVPADDGDSKTYVATPQTTRFLDAGGFALNFSDVEGTAHKYIAWAIEEGVDTTGPANLTASVVAEVPAATAAIVATPPEDPITVITHSVALPTSDNTTWDVDPAALSGITPKAVIISLSRAPTTSDTATDGAMFSYGAATGPNNQWSVAVVMEHDQGTTDTNRIQSDTYCARTYTTGTVLDSTLSFVEFHEGGAQFNFNYINVGGLYANFVFICGDQLNALADTDLFGTAQQTYDGLTFTPELLIAGATGGDNIDISNSSAQMILGVATGTGTNITEFHQAQFSSSGAAASTNGQDVRNDGFSGQINTYQVTCDEFNSTGFKHTANDAGAVGEYFGFLALGFGTSGANVWTDVISLPTSTGDTSFTDVGGDGPDFKPQWVGMFPSLCTTINTSEETTSLTNGFANFDSAREYCITFSDDDGADPTDTQSIAEDKALKFPDNTGATSYVATASGVTGDRFESAGFALNFSAVESTAQLAIAFAIEDVSAVTKTASVVATTGPTEATITTELTRNASVDATIGPAEAAANVTKSKDVSVDATIGPAEAAANAEVSTIYTADVDATTGPTEAAANVTKSKDVSVDATTGPAEAAANVTKSKDVSVDATTGPTEAAANVTKSKDVSVDATTGPAEVAANVTKSKDVSVDATTGPAEVAANVTKSKDVSVAATTGPTEASATAVKAGAYTAQVDATTGPAEAAANVTKSKDVSVDATTGPTEAAVTTELTRNASVDATTGPAEAAANVTKSKDVSVAATIGPAEAAANVTKSKDVSVDATTGPTEASATAIKIGEFAATVNGITGPTEAEVTTELTRTAQVDATTGPTEAAIATELTKSVSVDATTGPTEAAVNVVKRHDASVDATVYAYTQSNTDPEIDSAVGWNLQNTTISGGKGIFPGDGIGTQYASWPGALNIKAGERFRVAFEIVNYVDGLFTVLVGNSGVGFGSSNGIKSGYVTANEDATAANTCLTSIGTTDTFDVEWIHVEKVEGVQAAANVTKSKDVSVDATTGPAEASATTTKTKNVSVDATTGPTESSVDTDLTRVASVDATTGPAEAAVDTDLTRIASVDATTGPAEATIAAEKAGAHTASVAATIGATEASVATELTHIATVDAITAPAEASATAIWNELHAASVAATTGPTEASASAVRNAVHTCSVAATTGPAEANVIVVRTHTVSVAATTAAATANADAAIIEHLTASVVATAPAVTANANVFIPTDITCSVTATVPAVTASGRFNRIISGSGALTVLPANIYGFDTSVHTIGYSAPVFRTSEAGISFHNLTTDEVTTSVTSSSPNGLEEIKYNVIWETAPRPGDIIQLEYDATLGDYNKGNPTYTPMLDSTLIIENCADRMQ